MRRILTSRGANLLANLLLCPNVSDLTGSYRLYKRHILEELIKSVKGRAYVFQMEIIVRAQHKKLSIAEVPIIFVDRLYGESKLGANEIVAYLKYVTYYSCKCKYNLFYIFISCIFRGLWSLFMDL